MGRERNKQTSLLLWTLIAGLLSQNLLIPVMSITSVEDQKNYCSPDPHAGSPPTGSHGSPSHGSGGSHGSTPPTYGDPSHGGGGSHGSTPTPGGGGSHGSTPSHGGGGSHGSPSHGGSGGSSGGSSSPNCGNPPSGGQYGPTPTPSTGGGSGGSSGGYYSPPTSPPSSGGGTPSTPIIETPPATLTPPTIPSIEPGTPTIPSIDPGTPTIPIISPPTPTVPIVYPGTPAIPGISTPSPPFPFDPNSLPFPCNYWSTHPGLILGVLGWWGTMGGLFSATSAPGFSPNLSLQQALSNPRADGFGALYREGSASLLNSMVDKRFPFTTQQVRENFVAAMSSNKAAASQARVFKLANEGRMKPRA